MKHDKQGKKRVQVTKQNTKHTPGQILLTPIVKLRATNQCNVELQTTFSFLM